MPIKLIERVKKSWRTHIMCVVALAMPSCAQPDLRRFDVSSAQQSSELRLNIPNENWVPIFFKSINKRAELANLHDLKSTSLPENDLEIRVWSGFGVSALQGFIIARKGDRWTAAHIPPIKPTDPNSYHPIPVVPRSGWERLWERITKEDILTLPDSSQLPDGEDSILDGVSYVVEINMNRTYRTYMYGNPQQHNSLEAKRMVNIVNILFEEFLNESKVTQDR